jgi:hypothetical protein
MDQLLRVLFPTPGFDKEAEPERLAPAPRREDPEQIQLVDRAGARRLE